MKCLIVFDNLNDIIYMKCNRSFSHHIHRLTELQGFSCDDDLNAPNPNVVMQLFSPMITSQRIMMNHFSNPYSSVTCDDGITFIFDEYVGYLFIAIGYDDKFWLKRLLSVFVSITKHVCGPDVSLLKSSSKANKIISSVIDSWYHLAGKEQAILIEAIEQLRVNNQVANTCIKTLTEATDKIKNALSYSHVHALIMVNHRFLSLYSTRNASELLASDILFLSLVGEVLERGTIGNDTDRGSFITVHCDSEDSDDELEIEDQFYSPSSSKTSETASVLSAILTESEKTSVTSAEVCELSGNFIFLLGKQKPHAVHISYIAPSIPVFLLYEVGHEYLNLYMLETLLSLCSLQDIHVRGTTDRDVIHSAVENVENWMKKLNDTLKKKSLSGINKAHLNSIKLVSKKWELIRKKYQEYLKNHNRESLQKIDSSIDNVVALLRCAYSTLVLNDSSATANHDVVTTVLRNVRESLTNYTDVFRNKASRNLTLGTKSTLSINKYLEEFPGLVHFMYIDRITHRFVAPNLNFSSEETTNLTRKKIWSMVQFARNHLQEGITALMWKDTVFNYSYFLWFEDLSGTPLKPKIPVSAIIKSLPAPGVLTGDFFNILLKKCFLASPSHKIRCYELFCVHLALVTNSCVLEQNRRLTATIWEVTGVPTNPLDFL